MKTILKEEGQPLNLLQTYLSMILGSVGSNQYRQLFVGTGSEIKDVIGNGDLGCAYFVSSILTLCGLTTEGVHTTVDETVRDLEASGWEPVHKPKVGSVVIWTKKMCSDGNEHRHIGFYIGGDDTISNNATLGVPLIQPLMERDGSGRPKRLIETYYFHPRLGIEK